MADERTEQPTPKRREESRRRGEIPRSHELAGAAALGGALLGLRAGWRYTGECALALATSYLAEASRWEAGLRNASQLFISTLVRALPLVAPLTSGAVAAALAANLLQSGFLVSLHPLTPKWNRVSISQGLLRMLSRQALFTIVRSLAKLGTVFIVAFFFLRTQAVTLFTLGFMPLPSAVATFGQLLWGLGLRVAAAFAVIAALDYGYQRWEHERRLRMTRQEVREDYKQTEGDPLLRSRLRERQRALARYRMMEAVPRATVVITNPLEIAVALRYDVEESSAPIVVAKGRRLVADRIREIALRHNIPITPSPELARALYRSVPLGRQIPPELYQAVAEILAFIMRLPRGREG